MAFIKNYIRSLLGLGGEDTPAPHFKRTRIDDDNSIEDEFPSLKKLRSRPSNLFPDIETIMNDDHKKVDNSRVRYVPIQVEAGHPSTSTPNLSYEKVKYRNVPIQYVDVIENGIEKDVQKPRKHTPVRRAVHVVSDEDDDNDITFIDAESKTPRKPIYIDLAEDEENDCEPSDDVILVKKIKSPKPLPEYKFFVSRNADNASSVKQAPQFYHVLKQKKVPERTFNLSPRSYSKFKAPAGISKTYKKAPTPVPKWMQPLKPMNHSSITQARNNYMNLTGNARSAISKVFNLDEKRNYQELIKHVTSSNKPLAYDSLNLSDRSFKSTIQSQKNSLNQIKFVERGLANEKETESTREYDPITVASINSSDSEVEIIPSESSSSSVKINRVNSLKDANRDNPVTSEDWLARLDSKYRKKRQDTQDKLKDARRESDIISKVNYEQKLAQLEHKLKYELSIPESLIEEVPPTAELPELTPEQEKLVNRALGPGPPGQLLVEKFNLRITRRDLQTLAGLNWLNDEVINFYMNLLMQRSEERKDLPKVYAANTFFYPKLMQSGQAGLKRWTRKIDIFAHDLMVVPVHLGVHWCVSLIDFKEKRVAYLDSMGGRNQACLDALMKYLHDEHKDKKGALFDDSGWKTECLSKNIPQQMNGSDCGMFSCTFAEFSARNAPYTFSQQHMPYLRRKMALEILQGKLLL